MYNNTKYIHTEQVSWVCDYEKLSEIGWTWYIPPLGVFMFYSDNTDSPDFIFCSRGITVWLRDGYDYEQEIFEIDNTDIKTVFADVFSDESVEYFDFSAEKTDIPNPNSKITLIRQENKILLFHNPNSNYQGVIFDMRKPLSLWISYDEMKSWGKKIVLCDEPMFYPHAFLDNEKRMVYLASENARTHFLMKIPYAELEKE